MQTSAGTTANYLIRYRVPLGEFKFISKDSLAYFKSFVNSDLDSDSYDLNDFVDKLRSIGLVLDITQKQLDAISKGETKVRFKTGSVYWVLTGDNGEIVFNREESKFIEFTMGDVFKACAKHRLVFTNSFYQKFLNLLSGNHVVFGIDNSSNYVYNEEVIFSFSRTTDGELGVDKLSYNDNAEYRETELHISGNVNIDTRVEELAKILDEYTGIDLYSFDTTRITNMLKGDAVQEFRVRLERDLGDSHVRISVINNGEKTFQFSVIFTRKY